MVEQGPSFGTDRDGADEGESEGLDLAQLRELGGFALRAAQRHRSLALVTFLTVAILGLALSATLPPTYTATVKFLAQRSSTIRALAGEAQQLSDDNPTRNVTTMIMRRDNLVALAKDARLAERFSQSRPPALRLKDRVMGKIFGKPSPDDLLLGLVYTLEQKLTVEVLPDEATIVITVEWSNPQIAFDLITLVQKNFQEARYDADVAAINDSIVVLDDHSKQEAATVDSALQEYEKIIVDRASRPKPSALITQARVVTIMRPGSTVPTTFVPSPDLMTALEQKRAEIKTLQEAQEHSLEGVRQQLMQAQLTLTAMHPSVIALQQQVDAMSQPTPDLVRARAEERDLMAQIAPPAEGTAAVHEAARPFARPATEGDAEAPPALALPLESSLDRDGPLRLAESKLTSAINSYQNAMSRIDAAKVELDITRAAYKHRYTVVTPAELPRKPKKPTGLLVGLGSVVGGALLAILLAVASDLAGGLILETWQIRRKLKLEVLAELDRPSL
jgi:uncharacterized protein involved in exopolysaccharide biosynthesis